jgi:hypothetical protein
MREQVKAIVASMLLYVIAFNVVFFVQELFLVLPKSMTPGLEATLYHNNHRWTGESPLAALFQGTGAIATIVLGTMAYLASAPSVIRSPSTRLLTFWLAYCGWFMALPQFVIGALSPQSDVGMAMGYFALSATAKQAIAWSAFALAIPLAWLLMRRLLTFASDAAEVDTAIARSTFVCLNASLPALLAIAPLIAYRVPREWIEVLFLPIAVALVGIVWMQVTALVTAPTRRFDQMPRAIAAPLAGAIALLVAFQLVLRPGIVFP